MSYHIELEQLPAQPTVALCVHTNVLNLPRVMGEAYGELMRYLGDLGEQPVGMPYAAYHTLDMQDLEVELGFPVARPLPAEGALQASQLPGGYWAKVLHVGPYEACGPAYEALTSWIKEHGYESTGVAYEAYCSEPDTPPQEIRTWIMFPLKTAPEAVAASLGA